MTPRPLYLHIGVSKSGTSALQRSLWRSVEPLASVGVGLPLVGRPEHVRHLLRPLGYRAAAGFPGPIETGALRDLTARIQNTAGDRLLLSVEDVAEADAPRIKAFVDAAARADVDVRVVVTARNLAKQLPSEWQQYLKHRRTVDYPSFLEEVRTRSGEDGATFWWRQHLPEICARWGLGLPPENVHLITVPPVSEDPEAVFRLFGSVLGFDHQVLRPQLDAAVNESYGYLEAEMLRRVNVALGDRLTDFEREYQPAVRKVLVRQVIQRGASARITLPPEHLDWVQETSREWVETLRTRGYTLHGDPESLVPGPGSAAPLPTLDDAEMAARAVQTLADFAVRVHQESKGRKPTPAEATEATDSAETSEADAVRAGWLARLRNR